LFWKRQGREEMRTRFDRLAKEKKAGIEGKERTTSESA
jgi:hypothetical protein